MVQTLPDCAPAAPYRYALVATGGVSPYTWSLVGSQLPDGLALSASGEISGTPSAADSNLQGDFQFTVKVVDAAGSVSYKNHLLNDFSPSAQNCDDEPDNRILECAATADADVIVTGDRAMLNLKKYQEIRILSLRQFLDEISILNS